MEPEWEEARYRLQAYLRALQLTNPEQQERIISRVLRVAGAKQAEQPGTWPTSLAMNEVRELSERWFGKLLATQERASITGMVALFALDAPKKWPAVFLAEEIPEDFQRAVRECAARAAPDLKVSSMVPQPFENPLPDVNLPRPLVELTKDLVPLATKLFTLLFSIWTGNRLR
jgi:hypothetical protein